MHHPGDNQEISDPSCALGPARRLTAICAMLALIAAGAGLLFPSVYRDPAAIVPALRGQDLLTLLALPVLLIAVVAAGRGSAAGRIIWFGILSYLAYVSAGAAFGYYLNSLVLVYIALLSTAAFSLGALCRAIDAADLERRFGDGVPRRSVAAFLIMIAVLLLVPEVGQIAAFLSRGEVPELITRAGAISNFVYVLDLGAMVPLCVLGTILLLRRRPWGIVISGGMLIKCATMGLALVLMDVFVGRAGGRVDFVFTGMYAAIAVGGLGFSTALLLSRRRAPEREEGEAL